MELKDSVAIVTGGARGIGRGIAYELAKRGARIAIADLPSTAGDRDETIAGIKKLGSNAIAIDCDVREFEQAQAMVAQTIEKLGRVDVLVNNAGVIKLGPVVAFSEDDWDLIIDVNVKGTFLCSKAVIPHMTQRGSGRIVNLSSIAGKRGRPFASAYCTSKWAVIGFTQSLAHELAPANINVNAICPGEVDTYMWRDVILPLAAAGGGVSKDEAWNAMLERDVPLKRPQTVEDMGQAVVFLCEADNITGIAMNVSGGTGEEGMGLAFRFARAGHACIIGSRSQERADGAVAELREHDGALPLRGAGNEEAAAVSDIIIITTPYTALAATLPPLAGACEGKIVVSTVVPMAFEGGRASLMPVREGSAAQQQQALLPGARIVAAFQNLSARKLLKGAPLDADVVVCSDDKDAKAQIMDLAAAIGGVRGVDGGALANSQFVEAITVLLVSINRAYKTQAGIKIAGI